MRAVPAIVLFMAVVMSAGADDFTWSWQQPADQPVTVSPDNVPAHSGAVPEAVAPSMKSSAPSTAPTTGPMLEWKWQGGQVSAQPAAQRGAAHTLPTIEPTIDKENRELRKRADQLDSDNQSLREQNARLQARTIEQEGKLRQMGDSLRELEVRVMRAPTPERVQDLEKRLSESEQQRLGLVSKMVDAQAGMNLMKEENAQLRKNDESRAKKSAELMVSHDGVLKENLDLRKSIADLSVRHQGITNQNTKLITQVKGLEGQITELASVIAALEQAKRALPTLEQFKEMETKLGMMALRKDEMSSKLEEAEKNKLILEKRLLDISKVVDKMEEERKTAVPLERVKEIEASLAESERIRKALTSEMESMQKRIVEMKAAEDRRSIEMREDLVGGSRPGGSPRPGSDLFGELERTNIELKAKIHDLTAENGKLLEENTQLTKKSQDAAAQLAELTERTSKLEQESATLRADLLSARNVLPSLEEEIARLRGDVAAKDKSLEEANRDIVVLKSEVELRDHRLEKVAKLSAVMDRARDDVKQVVDKQNRDAHYNMAVTFARDGKYRDAEREYLAALSLDPNDADSHYNLGILYDEQLSDPKRAATHYRQYLKLVPYAGDADNVRSWLMKLDLDGGK